MYRTTHRIRKAGVAALVAVTMVSGLVFAPSADAAAATNTDVTLTALAQPTIGQGKTNQAAGPLRLTVDAEDTLTAGDAIRLTVDDNAAPEDNCLAGDTVAFSALPTVTVTGTAAVVASLESSGAGCGNDRLFLNVTTGGSAVINITNIAYNTGAGADVGPVDVIGTHNGGAVDGSPVSNAYITTTLLTANNPPKGATHQDGANYVISPLVIAEQSAAAADGDLCIQFNDDIEDAPLTQPTVAVTGGSDTAAVTADAATNRLFLDVTPSGPATASTFTISGVVLERDDFGLQSATVFADDDDECFVDNAGAQLTDGNTTVGYVGDVDRYGGSDRNVTAQILFEKEFGCFGPDFQDNNQFNAIIARNDLYPDALAASYLAGDVGTGILLSGTNSIPASTLNALRNEGVENVYLMGGTSALSAAVANQFDATQSYECDGSPRVDGDGDPITLTVQRIGGQDRFGTAELISQFPGLSNPGCADINGDADDDEDATTAIVASGLNFPDALAAGALAYNGDNDACGGELPLLLARTDSMPTETMNALGNLNVVNVIVVGGTAAVSDAAVAQLTAAGYTVKRVAGINRQATAVALATMLIQDFDYDTSGATIARGDDFPDSLTGGPVSGNSNEAILLTGSPSSLSTETAGLLRTWRVVTSGDTGLFWEVLGGTAAVSAAVVQELVNAASQQ